MKEATLLLCRLSIIFPLMVFGAVAQSAENEHIVEFLNSSNEIRSYERYGYTSTFSGKFQMISPELNERLKSAFPHFEFYLAEMNVLIDPPSSKYVLVVVSDERNNEVQGFVWANYWMLGPSKSFESIFKDHSVKSSDEAIDAVRAFANLLVLPTGDRIGSSTFKNRKIKTELIRGNGVLGILEVEIDERMIFRKMRLTDRNGKKLRYFV